MPDYLLFALLFGAVISGIYLERLRARWAKRRWLAKRGTEGSIHGAYRNTNGTHGNPNGKVDAAEQLRTVMAADFESRPLLSKSEARVLYAAEDAVKNAKLGWRVMAQVSLGEVLSSPDTRAHAAINSKRVDILIISRTGVPLAAIEYQGTGHYQGSAAARDAVKKEALRKAGVRYIEVTHEHKTEDVVREIVRLADGERAKLTEAS
jgi:hypothetical protein